MDMVFIRNLSVRGKHGVGEEERKVEQEFIFDIEATLDVSSAGLSDTLTDTVDYDVFRTLVQQIVGNNSFMLIERLGERVAQEILKDQRIQKVVVTIRKPAVWENGVPGITISRERMS